MAPKIQRVRQKQRRGYRVLGAEKISTGHGFEPDRQGSYTHAETRIPEDRYDTNTPLSIQPLDC